MPAWGDQEETRQSVRIILSATRRVEPRGQARRASCVFEVCRASVPSRGHKQISGCAAQSAMDERAHQAMQGRGASAFI